MDSALSDINSIPIDTAIKQTYGRFQVFTTIVYSIGFWMGGFITFALQLTEIASVCFGTIFRCGQGELYSFDIFTCLVAFKIFTTIF